MTETMTSPATPRLKTKYSETVVPSLKEQFGYGNPMQVPRVVKVVVNMGVGDAAKDSKLIEGAIRDLTAPSISLLSLAASPTPMLTTTLTTRGTCIALP